MRDDILSNNWADNHGKLTSSLHRLIGVLGRSLARLNAYQFDAPWHQSGPAAKDADRISGAAPGATWR